MKVCFPTPATFDRVRGGGERYPLNLARGLVHASGGEVEVEFVVPADEPDRRRLEPGIWLRGVTVNPPGAPYGDGLSWDLVDAVAGADVVHVHQVFTQFGEVAVVAARLFGRPLCVTDHGGTTSSMGRRLGLLDLADALVAYSQFGVSMLETEREVTVIEGGIDTDFFSPPPFPLPRDRVVFVGRLLPHKGVDLLIRACPPDIPLFLAGTPGPRFYMDDLAALSAGRNVTILTDADDESIRDLYRRAICAVLPSVHVDMYGQIYRAPELMGMTMLEGMSCGSPGLCMRTAALPEYVEDGVTGFVVDDVDALARRIGLLAHDPARVAELGAAAHAMVVSRWNLERSGATLLALYRQLQGA